MINLSTKGTSADVGLHEMTMGFFSIIACCVKKRLNRGVDGGGVDGSGGETPELLFGLQSLQIATNFFFESNKLGHGGFGPVYKGLMPNGQEVAVKKLSLNSRQGMKEFANEVKLLLKIQHKNLVTLLGCCIEGPEKMLVYEYLPNRSLDYFLFDVNKSAALDWPRRFKVITGVARGLLYLHEDAPVRIIHRDIKASNILLDEHLNPKISDFGLARLFPGDDTHFDTLKVSGTYGYMAPEYVTRGYASVKTDVFSYGILVLEIVSGRKNHNDRLGADQSDLLRYAWMLFQEGKTLELVDTNLKKYIPAEAAMCVQLGLLCCQAAVADRPHMSSVNLMLSSESFNLPRPGKPGIHGRHGYRATTSSTFTKTNASSSTATAVTKTSPGSSYVEESSKNSVSLSSLEGR